MQRQQSVQVQGGVCLTYALHQIVCIVIILTEMFT